MLMFHNSLRLKGKTLSYQICRFRYSFICQGTSTRRQQSDLFGFESSCHLLLPV